MHRQAEHHPLHMVGPFVIKQQRNEIKRYGAMFMCIASQAVHMEIAHRFDIDFFIQALR